MTTNKNILTEGVTKSDFGEFTDPAVKTLVDYVFVNKDLGYIPEDKLRTIIKQIMKEELSKLLIDMGAFQEIGGSLYYGSKRLVYASDIFLT